MPLHLLGKKSWNVYNADNIARVRRDEAAAAAREAADEERMQAVDAERRMRLLRGLPVDDLAASAVPPSPASERQPDGAQRPARRADTDEDDGRSRKRRRLAGEDDTERDIRHAREERARAQQRAEAAPLRKPRNIPLTDANGNINLFAADEARKPPRPPPQAANPEAAAEDARKKRELEDHYTMRFANAAGFKRDVGAAPWYAGAGPVETDDRQAAGTDAWGRADPRRKERDQRRVAQNDPLAAMQRGVQGVRRVERERREWQREKRREVEDLIRDEKRRRRERRRSRRAEDGDVEEFSLDSPDEERRSSKHRDGHRRHHHRHEDDSSHCRHHDTDRRTSDARSSSHREHREPVVAT